jgi:hypothetical protein
MLLGAVPEDSQAALQQGEFGALAGAFTPLMDQTGPLSEFAQSLGGAMQGGTLYDDTGRLTVSLPAKTDTTGLEGEALDTAKAKNAAIDSATQVVGAVELVHAALSAKTADPEGVSLGLLDMQIGEQSLTGMLGGAFDGLDHQTAGGLKMLLGLPQ